MVVKFTNQLVKFSIQFNPVRFFDAKIAAKAITITITIMVTVVVVVIIIMI